MHLISHDMVYQLNRLGSADKPMVLMWTSFYAFASFCKSILTVSFGMKKIHHLDCAFSLFWNFVTKFS